MESTETNESKGRKRGLTSLTLTWLAERVRKVNSIKEQIDEDAYDPSGEKIAKSLLSEDE